MNVFCLEETGLGRKSLKIDRIVSTVLSGVVGVPGGGTPIHYLYGYVPPNRVAILKLLI